MVSVRGSKGTFGPSRSRNAEKSSVDDRSRTEELLATSTFLDDLNEAGLQLFDGRYMIGQDTHFSRLSRYIDLNTAIKSYISARFLRRGDGMDVAQRHARAKLHTHL